MNALDTASTRASGPRFSSPGRVAALFAVVVGLGSLGMALWLQHQKDMLPCAWCVLQRLETIVAVFFARRAALTAGVWRRLFAGVGILTALAGLASALWQHFYAANDLSCALTLADRIVGSLGLDSRWPAVFQAQAMCNEANLPWLGVPFALWGALLFVTLTVALSVTLFGRSGR